MMRQSVSGTDEATRYLRDGYDWTRNGHEWTRSATAKSFIS